MSLLAAGIGAVGNVAGTLVTNAMNERYRQRAVSDARQDATTAYNRQIEFWNMQNAYNDPSAQYQRLKDAGLNPNFAVGGQSAIDAGSAGSAPSIPKAQSVNAQRFDNMMNIGGVLNTYQDFRLKKAQEDKIREDIRLTRERANIENQTYLFNELLNPIRLNTSQKNLDNLSLYSSDIMDATLENLRRRNTAITDNIALKHSYYDLEKMRFDEFKNQFDKRFGLENKKFLSSNEQFIKNLSLQYALMQQRERMFNIDNSNKLWYHLDNQKENRYLLDRKFQDNFNLWKWNHPTEYHIFSPGVNGIDSFNKEVLRSVYEFTDLLGNIIRFK